MPFQGRYIIITIYFALCFAMCLLILVKFILPLESNLVLFASIINLKGSFTKTSVSPGPPILSATKPKLLKYPVITSSQNLTCHSERSAAEESIKKIRYSSSVPCRPFSVIASSAALKVRPLDHRLPPHCARLCGQRVQFIAGVFSSVLWAGVPTLFLIPISLPNHFPYCRP